MGEPPCTEAAIRRARVAEIARAVVADRTDIAGGAREIAMLRLDVDPGEEDADLMAMDAVAAPGRSDERSRESVIHMFMAIAQRYGQHA